MDDLPAVIISGLVSGSAYALLALGIVIIFRSTDTVNFAIGDIGTLGVFVAGQSAARRSDRGSKGTSPAKLQGLGTRRREGNRSDDAAERRHARNQAVPRHIVQIFARRKAGLCLADRLCINHGNSRGTAPN
jgi:hypothetical protein